MPTPLNRAATAGPTVAILIRDRTDPWIKREILSEAHYADEHGFRLAYFDVCDKDSLEHALSKACAEGAQGVILDTPEFLFGSRPLWPRYKNKLKFLGVNYGAPFGDGSGPRIPTIGFDARQVGAFASHEMLTEAKRLRWDLAFTGAILFTSGTKAGMRALLATEAQTLRTAGVEEKNIFLIPLSAFTIAEARAKSFTVLQSNSHIRNWFFGGPNDFSVIGGVRGASDVHIGVSRTLGIGIEGDGALYDLELPVSTGIAGSVLLPAEEIGTRAMEKMVAWVRTGREPEIGSPFRGVILNRQNARRMKRDEHLVQ